MQGVEVEVGYFHGYSSPNIKDCFERLPRSFFACSRKDSNSASFVFRPRLNNTMARRMCSGVAPSLTHFSWTR